MSRMIDADELNKVKFHPLPYTHIVPNGENAESYERGWNDAIDAIISDAPTVDAVPVVHGKWVDNGTGGHECSVCHICAPSFRNGRENLSSYCPLCGARMS